MRSLLVAPLILLVCLTAFAQSTTYHYLKSLDGREFRDFAIAGYTPDGIVLQIRYTQYDVSLAQLPPGLRERVRPFCDQENARQAAQKEEERAAQARMEEGRARVAAMAQGGAAQNPMVAPVPITTSNGKLYQVVAVLEYEEKGLRFVHTDGVVTVPYEDLSSDWREKLKAKLTDVKERQGVDEWENKVKMMAAVQAGEKARKIKVKVSGVFKDGVQGLMMADTLVGGKVMELPGREVWLRGGAKTKGGGTFTGYARPDGYHVDKAKHELYAVWWVQ